MAAEAVADPSLADVEQTVGSATDPVEPAARGDSCDVGGDQGAPWLPLVPCPGGVEDVRVQLSPWPYAGQMAGECFVVRGSAEAVPRGGQACVIGARHAKARR